MTLKSFLSRISGLFASGALARLRKLALFFLVYTGIYLVVYFTFPYTAPFVFGLLFALLLERAVKFIVNRLGLARPLISLIITAVFFLALTGVLAWASHALVKELAALLGRLDGARITEYIRANYRELLDFLAQASVPVRTVASWATYVVGRVPLAMIAVLAVLFSTYYFSRELPAIGKRLRSLFSDKAGARAGELWTAGLSMLGRYVRMSALICFLTFALTLVFFVTVRVGSPVMLALLSGVADLFPVAGPGTVYIPLAAYRILTGDLAGGAVILGG